MVNNEFSIRNGNSGLVPLTINSSGNATFAGNVALTGDLRVTADASTADIVAQWADSNGNNTATFRTTTPGQIFEIRSQNNGTLKFDSTISWYTGKIGIGTNGPVADLQVLSTKDGMTNGLNTNQLKLSYGASVVGAGSSVAFGVSSNNNFTGAKIVHERTASNSVGDLTFWTRQTGGTSTDYDLTIERMRIKSDGNIQLNAYGAGTLVTDASGNITASSGGGAGGPYLPLTAGPSYPLTGNLVINSTSSAIPVLLLNAAGNANCDITMQSTNTSSVTRLRTGVNDFQIHTNGSQRVTVNSAGNVGIGVTGPVTKLEVSSSLTSGIKVTNSGTINGEAGIEAYHTGAQTGTAYAGYITKTGAGGTNVGIYTAASGATNNYGLIVGSGNVGIGDTSPSTKIDVYQSTVGIGVADFRHVNGNRILINPSYNYYDAYNHIFRGLNGTDTHMTIDLNGNVGIGTTSPTGYGASANTLEVRGASGTGAGLVRVSNAGNTVGAAFYSGSASSTLGTQTNHELNIATNNTSRVVIGNTGAVKFSAYAAGTLVTDASGNISVSSGGGAGGPYLPLSAGSGSSLTDNLYINDVDQNNIGRYGNLRSEVGFTRSAVSGNRWFKVVALGGSPKRLKFSVISTGDNTNSYDNFLISTSGYGMNMHIQKLPGGKYNTSKLVSVAAINPSNSGSVEIWIQLMPIISNTGPTYVACTSDVLDAATILASSTATAPTLTNNDTQLDVSNDNRLYATLQTSRGATFGAKVGIGTNAPAAMLTVAGDSTISGNVGIGTTLPIGKFNVSKDSTTNGLSQAITVSSSSVSTKRMNLGYVPGSNYAFIDVINYAISNTNQALSLQPNGGNVGIGTTGPVQKLEVYQAATNSQAYVTVQNNRSRNAAVLTQTTNGGFYTGTSIGTDTLCWQVYDASAGERMVISSAGAIKFNAYNSTNNTGTPTYLLGTDASGNVVKVLGGDIPGGGGTVTGTGTADTVTKWNSAGTGIQDGPITFSGNNSSFAGKIGIPDGSDVFWGGGYGSGAPVLAANGTTMKMYPSGSTSGIQFSLSPTEAIFYGNVGIGVTGPGAKLDVAGTIKNTTYINTGGQAGAMLLGRGNAMSGSYLANDFLMFNTGGDCLILGTGGAGMIVKATTGNVGIGTTTPLAKLDIQGTQGQLFSVTDDLSGSIFAVSDISGVPIFDVNSSGVSYFDGKVGIGTTSPSSPLHISGTEPSNGVSLAITTGTDDIGLRANSTRLDIVSSTASVWRQLQAGSFVGNVNEISSFAGNVGIGVTSPGNKLSIAEDMGTTFSDAFLGLKATLAATANTKTAISLATSTVNNYGVTLNGIRQEATSGEPRFGINMHNNSSGGIEALSIRASGNVGIGVTGPGYKLDVAGTGNFTGNVAINGTKIGTDQTFGGAYRTFAFGNNANGYNRVFATNDASDGIYINASTGHGVNFRVNGGGSNVMVIDSSGNVGIGTTSPAAKLVVSDGTQAFSVNPHSTGIDLHSTGNLAPHYQTDFTLYTGAIGSGSARVTVNSAGNVGIGTTSPGSKLQVAGEIRVADGNKATPSYSFTNDPDTGMFSDLANTLRFGTGANTRMTIEPSGEVGINTTGPSAALHLRALTTNGVPFKLEGDSNTTVEQMLIITSKAFNSSDAWYNLVTQAGDGSGGATNTCIIERDGDLRNKNNSYGQISDSRLKENITDATPKLDDVMKVKVKNFNFIGEDLKQIGVVAQELEEVFPGLVKEDKQPDVNGEEGGIYKSVKYSVLVPILLKAMQEQQDQIEDLKTRITQLEN